MTFKQDWKKLETAVSRLLQRNRELESQRAKLLKQRDSWCQEQHRLLTEVEDLLDEIQRLRGVEE